MLPAAARYSIGTYVKTKKKNQLHRFFSRLHRDSLRQIKTKTMSKISTRYVNVMFDKLSDVYIIIIIISPPLDLNSAGVSAFEWCNYFVDDVVLHGFKILLLLYLLACLNIYIYIHI